MADIKIGAKSYSGIKKLNFPLSDGSGYAQFSQGGSETAEHSWNQIPELVRNFLDNVTYDPSDYTTSQIANYAPATVDVNNTRPIPLSLEISAGILDRNGYEISVDNGTVELVNDIPNQFTEYVVRNGGAVSQAGTIKPTGFLRQIKCVSSGNIRDLGGWTCDGGTVKYGKLFRGGEIWDSSARDIFVNQCGIRAELNLVSMTDPYARDYSVLGDDIAYYIPDVPQYYTLKNKTVWKEVIRFVFDCISMNLPVYFHCSAGADRTGTLACVLEALLGMSQSDIDKDYELTSFDTGTADDSHARRRNEAEWKQLINQINAYSGSTFRDKAVNFIASLGFTAKEINAFRSAMIDGNPAEVSVNIATYSITKNGTNVLFDNDSVSVNQYQGYSVIVTPNDGMNLESIQITMGGVDITTSSLTVIADGFTDRFIKGIIDIPNVTGNIVITATAKTGEIVNILDTIGYTDGKRCRTSGIILGDLDGATAFGWYDCSGLTESDVIRIYLPNGIPTASDQAYAAHLTSEDETTSIALSYYYQDDLGIFTNTFNSVSYADNILTLTGRITSSSKTKFRISARANGADCIMTLNQEIVV